MNGIGEFITQFTISWKKRIKTILVVHRVSPHIYTILAPAYAETEVTILVVGCKIAPFTIGLHFVHKSAFRHLIR